MLCLNCKSEIADSVKFCPKCGTSPKPTISTDLPTKPCPKCGTANAIGTKFCKKDGYRFEHAEEPVKQPPESSNTVVCPTCGTSNPIGAKFCRKDGYHFQYAEEPVQPLLPESPNTIACPACGTANPIGAKFCKKDGVRLVGDASPVARSEAPLISVVPQAPPAARSPIAEELPATALPVPPQPPEPIPRQKSIPTRSGGARKWAVVVAMLLVLIGGGTGGYLYYIGAFIGPAELKASIASGLESKGIQGVTVEVGDDRIATLSGFADDAAMRDVAIQLAGSVKGVKDVVAKLDVLPSISDTENRLSQTLRDQQLTNILVRVDEKRIATLTGNVGNAALIEVVTKAAAATLGVKSVTNHVNVMETPAVTYSNEPQPETASQPSPRPSPPPKAKRPSVGSGTPTPVPAAAPALGSAPAPAPERKRTTCEGTGGLYRLTCTIEGPEVYFKCAPDGRNWNTAIPGCNRGTTQN